MGQYAGPELKPKQLLTLNFEHAGKLQGRFVRRARDEWWVKLDFGLEVRPREYESLRLQFIYISDLVSGEAVVKSLDAKGELTLRLMGELESRPLRRHPRVDTRLYASLIVRGEGESGGEQNDYLYRTDNRVLNLSMGGAMLACNRQLPDRLSSLLLLVAMDAENPYEKASQIYANAELVRQVNGAGDEQFPYVYGLRFKRLQEDFRQTLQIFIDTAQGGAEAPADSSAT